MNILAAFGPTFSCGLLHWSKFSPSASSLGRLRPRFLFFPKTHVSHSLTHDSTSRWTRSSPRSSVNRCGRYRSTHSVVLVVVVRCTDFLGSCRSLVHVSLSARGGQDAYSLCGKFSCGSTIKVLEHPVYGDIQEVLELPILLRENPSSPLEGV